MYKDIVQIVQLVLKYRYTNTCTFSYYKEKGFNINFHTLYFRIQWITCLQWKKKMQQFM